MLHIPSMEFAPDQYAVQLMQKQANLERLFANLTHPEFEVFASPKLHFRMRAEFRVWHERDDSGSGECFHAMFEQASPKAPVRIEQYPVADKTICKLMPGVMQHINANQQLKHRLFQIEYLCTQTGEAVVTMIYHRQLDDEWLSHARELSRKLGCKIIGRARKQRLILTEDTVCETLTVGQNTYSFLQGENTFTQPNAAINEKMITWLDDYLASNIAPDAEESLLEMYCGIGNFTIPLSRHFNKVLATEISKNSMRLATRNCELNDTKNVAFVRLSGEETSQALDGVRTFRRLAHIDLDSYQISTVLVDPPRAGLDQQTLAFIQRFDRILYISCNPETLHNNLETLSTTHSVARIALFDQFPYTHHCECGVILEKKK